MVQIGAYLHKKKEQKDVLCVCGEKRKKCVKCKRDVGRKEKKIRNVIFSSICQGLGSFWDYFVNPSFGGGDGTQEFYRCRLEKFKNKSEANILYCVRNILV